MDGTGDEEPSAPHAYFVLIQFLNPIILSIVIKISSHLIWMVQVIKNRRRAAWVLLKIQLALRTISTVLFAISEGLALGGSEGQSSVLTKGRVEESEKRDEEPKKPDDEETEGHDEESKKSDDGESDDEESDDGESDNGESDKRDEESEKTAQRPAIEFANKKNCYYNDSDSDDYDSDHSDDYNSDHKDDFYGGRKGYNTYRCSQCRPPKANRISNAIGGGVKWADLAFDNELEGPESSFLDDSLERLEWLRLKRELNEENVHLDRMMSMIGYGKVKRFFLDVKKRKTLGDRWSKDSKNLKLDLILLGNDRTAKKKIAQIYAEFLYSIGAIPRRSFERVTGCSLPSSIDGPTVIFFENADNIGRKSDIEKILKTAGKERLVLIFSYETLKESSRNALRATPEARRRFPDPIVVEDYSEAETMQIFRQLIKKVESGGNLDDSLLHILARRLSRRRKRQVRGFVEFRAMYEMWKHVLLRRENRVEKEWVDWATTHWPNEEEDIGAQEPNLKQSAITREDILGPKPKDVQGQIEAWKSIQKMVGLQRVKNDIEGLFDLASHNYQLEAEGRDPIPISLNRCFLGDPGVGKTTVAVLYATIVAQLRLVSRGNIILKNASDLLGENIGQSENNTKKALAEANGNILVIDDAHMLYQNEHGTNSSDPFRTGIINTLVANISGTSEGDDRCVILVGYTDQMEQMLLNSNPGLQRRFPEVIKFASYNDEELCHILDQKMERDQLLASESSLKVARDLLSRMRNLPRFGNGGDVENLLARANLRRRERLKMVGLDCFNKNNATLEAPDFDPDYDRSSNADKNRDELFEGFVGYDKIIKEFRDYQKMAEGMRACGLDPRSHIPWAFIFKGPPGTGKTSTARKIGRLFCDMGLILSSEVVTCSVTDIIGEYIGHTGPKVINQFELGLGKVLFIDEAYRLAGNHEHADRFHQEAVAEIVDAMTKPRYVSNMVVILAGYDEDMERLLRSNPGLRSRFPTHITFPHLTSEYCYQLLKQQLRKFKIKTPSILDSPVSEERQEISEAFLQLSTTKGWANGRDIESLARNVMRSIFVKVAEVGSAIDPGRLTIAPKDLTSALRNMLYERGGKLAQTSPKKPTHLSEFLAALERGSDTIKRSNESSSMKMTPRFISSVNHVQEGSNSNTQSSKICQSSISELKDIDHDPLGADEIRLLEIHPGKPGEPLYSTLRTHSLLGAPSYQTLEGGVNSSEPLLWIICNDFKTPITTYLHTILNSIRKPNSSVLVWAEEFCSSLHDEASKERSQDHIFNLPSVEVPPGESGKSEPRSDRRWTFTAC